MNTPLKPDFVLTHTINWALKNGVYTADVPGLGSVEVKRVEKPERGGVAFSINGYRVSTQVSSNLDDAKRYADGRLREWLYLAQFKQP